MTESRKIVFKPSLRGTTAEGSYEVNQSIRQILKMKDRVAGSRGRNVVKLASTPSLRGTKQSIRQSERLVSFGAFSRSSYILAVTYSFLT